MCNHRRYSRPCRCSSSCRQCSRMWHARRTDDDRSRIRPARRSWTCRLYGNPEDTRTYKSRSRWRISCSRCSGDRPIHPAVCTRRHLNDETKKKRHWSMKRLKVQIWPGINLSEKRILANICFLIFSIFIKVLVFNWNKIKNIVEVLLI